MLKGLKVVDASTVLAGPSVGSFFAELGARVIKVEHPKHRDVTRSWKLPTENAADDVSAYFSSVNYGKEYQSIDLKTDRDSFLKLLEDADIVLMNFKRSDYQKFKLDDATLLELNPRLIIGKITGYGDDSDRVAYDLILQAESGFMSMNGQPDSAPTKMPVALIDVLSAHHLKEAILLALYQRERTGKGSSMSVSLFDAALSSLTNQASNYLMAGHVPTRMGSLHPNIAPYGELFQCADGSTITFAIGSNGHFEKLCQTLELNQLPKDSRFENNQQRIVNRKELQDLLQSSIANFQTDDLLNQLHKLNVPAAKIKNLKEVFASEQSKALILEEEIDNMLTKRVKSVIFNRNGN